MLRHAVLRRACRAFLQVKLSHTGHTVVLTGLSDVPASQLMFQDASGAKLSVAEYYKKKYKVCWGAVPACTA